MKKLYNLFKAIGYLLFLFEKSNSLNSSSKYGRVFEIINNLGLYVNILIGHSLYV